MLLRLWRFARPYRKQLAAGFALTLASTAATLVPPYLTIPLMDRVLIPYQSGQRIDAVLVWWLLAGLLGAALVAWAVWKADGLLRPEHLAGFVPGVELALVLPNVQKGPKAKAVPPGWVELKEANPFAGRTGGAVIDDVGPGTVWNFCPFGVLINDRAIEAWLVHLDTNYPGDGIPAAKRRNLIRNLRGYETDATKPAEPPTTLRCRENGTGDAIIESNGDLAGFAAQGVTPTNCGALLRDLWLFATPIVTRGPEVAA